MTDPDDFVATLRSSTSGGGAPPHRRTLLVCIGDAIHPHLAPLAGTLAIGRASTCDVRVDHPSISRTHLRLTLAKDELLVTDLDSANGTWLRGARLPPQVPVQVLANEPITAGEITLVVQEIHAGAAPAKAASPGRSSGRISDQVLDPILLDPAMRRLYDLAARVARGTIGVLLVGETGTGKEVLAEFVHRASPRAAGPLVRVNCAALAESLVESELFGHDKGAFTGALQDRPGLLEVGSGGTVFLDEIGEVPLATQAKLLRVLEDGMVTRVGATAPRPIDVRFVAATNRDLEAEVEAGRFRRDLYFRIAGVVLAIPPLRERCDEILALARRFATETASRLGRPTPRLDEPAIAALGAHPWPGNARELRNAIERAVLLVEGDVIGVEHLPFAAPAPSPAPSGSGLADELANLERQRIVAALEQCQGNQTRAAALLGMPRRTLIKRLDEYGLERPRKK